MPAATLKTLIQKVSTGATLSPDEMRQVAALIARALRHRGDDAALAAVAADVRTLCAGFQPYAG